MSMRQLIVESVQFRLENPELFKGAGIKNIDEILEKLDLLIQQQEELRDLHEKLSKNIQEEKEVGNEDEYSPPF